MSAERHDNVLVLFRLYDLCGTWSIDVFSGNERRNSLDVIAVLMPRLNSAEDDNGTRRLGNSTPLDNKQFATFGIPRGEQISSEFSDARAIARCNTRGELPPRSLYASDPRADTREKNNRVRAPRRA